MPDLHFVGVSGGGSGGGGYGVYARGFPANVPVEIKFGDQVVAATVSQPDGTVTHPLVEGSTLPLGELACVVTAEVVNPLEPDSTEYVNAMGYFMNCPEGGVEGDLDNDCDVDFGDFRIFADNWLLGK